MTRSRRGTAKLLAACLLAAGCSGGEPRVRAIAFDRAHPIAARPADARVQLFTEQGPECAYEPIGTISVEGQRPLPSRETLSAVAREARRIGGEAIIGLGVSGRRLAGTVVRFKDSTCTR